MGVRKPLLIAVVVTSMAAVVVQTAECKRGTTEPEKTTFKIGVVLPYSGPLAAFGEEGKQGIDLAVEHGRAEYGAALYVSVKYEDSRGDQADTARAFRKLVDVDKVDAVLGEVDSTNTLSIAPLAQELRVPLVVPASTNADITRDRDFVIRVCFLDSQQGSVMAGFAYRDLGIKQVAVFFDKGDDYSVGLSTAFKKAFQEAGGSIVGESVFRPEDPDFSAQLVQIRDWGPDAVFLPAKYAQAGQILRQARRVGLECRFLGGDAWSSPRLFEIGGEAVDGAFITAHFAPDNTAGAAREFVQAFERKYGSKPSNMAALSYDAARVLLAAGMRREVNTALALRDALFATRDFRGATGTFSIGEDGNPVKEIMILETSEGRFRYIKTVVPGSGS